MVLYFSRVTPESRKQWLNTKGKKDFQPRILYPLKLQIKCESRINTFLHASYYVYLPCTFSQKTLEDSLLKKKKKNRERERIN